MNKLISRNPVLRFKLGRKVLFAKEGTYRGIRVLLVATSNGKEMYGYNDPKSGKRILIYGNLLDVKTGKGNANGYIYKGSDGKWYQNGKIVTKFSSPTSTASETVIPETTVKPDITQRSNSFNKYGMAGDVQRNWNGLVGTIDDESIKMLEDLGLDTSNARAALDSLNTLLTNNDYGFSGLVASDNKWGNQSRSTLKYIWDMWKMRLDRLPKAVEEPPLYLNPGIRAAIEAEIPTTPEIETEKAIINNTPNLTNFPMNYRIKADRSITRDIINELGGNAYDYTGFQRKALRHYINGDQLDDKMKGALSAFGDLSRFDRYKNTINTINKPFMKLGGILPSRNIVERFKQGRKIVFAAEGTPIKRFVLSNTEGFKKEFDTEAEAKAYRKANNITGVIRDLKGASNGSVVKVSRVAGKDAKTTAYDRQEAEKYNHLSQKDAYKAALKSGNKYFAYRGKVYKTDLNNGKDNMTDMMKMYGNNLGWDKDPNLGTKKSMAARALYRKDIDAKQGNRNAVYKGKTNKLASAEADKKVAQTWNERDFVDAILPATAVGNALNAAGSWMSGEKFTPKVFHSGLNAAGGMADLMEGNWSNVGERFLNAASIFGGPWIGKGVKWLGVKAAPKIATVSDKSRYLFNTPGTKLGTKFLEDGSGKVLNNFAESAISKGNGFRFGTGASSYGRYSIQNAIDLGVLNGNKVLPKVSQWANTAVRNGNTGTTYFYRNVDKAGNLIAHPYDAAVDNAVKIFPWLSSVGGSVSSTTLNNFSE